jgi:GxxExxY protein
MLHEDITEKILDAFYAVYNRLGYGFLERVYENAMMIELHERGVKVSQQTPMRVWYKGQVVGEYYADLLV